MRDFELALDLSGRGRGGDGDAGVPAFLRIARAVASAISDGRLRAGAPLPGSRTLAESLGVHRNTVLAALRELESEGWVESRPARGTFVRAELPERAPRALRGMPPASRDPARAGFELRGEVPSPESLRHHGSAARMSRGTLALAGGVPDLRLLPQALLGRAIRRAIARDGRRLLGYSDEPGDPRLRAALGSMLARMRGIAEAERGLVVTRGSQMALHLAARAVLAPGDVVAVEGLGYRPAWEALRLAGARLVPIPVDGEGCRVDAVAALCARRRVRAVYVTPHHQYPTTSLLAAGRRLALLDLARRHGFAILEDDYDNEFHYDGRPPLPLASADTGGHVIYIGTLSKILAPGLRLGFLVAPEPLAARAAALRLFIDRQGDLVVERAIAELLEDGEIQRHARKMKRVYHARRDAMVAALGRHLGDSLAYEVPAGGLAIWCRVARGLDVEAWAERAAAAGVLIQTGRRFSFDGRPRSAIRIGYAPTTEREIEIAVRRLAEARGRRWGQDLHR